MHIMQLALRVKDTLYGSQQRMMSPLYASALQSMLELCTYVASSPGPG